MWKKNIEKFMLKYNNIRQAKKNSFKKKMIMAGLTLFERNSNRNVFLSVVVYHKVVV